MPLYEYECLECGERFEVIQKFSDAPFSVHSEYADATCDGPVRKLLSAPAIQFKGSGWYVTDYGKGGKKPTRESAESSSDSTKKDSKSSDKSSSSTKPPAAASGARSGGTAAAAS